PAHPRPSGDTSPPRFAGQVSRASTAAPGADPDELGRWPVEAKRYGLAVCLARPRAHQVVITRRLLGLEEAISLAVLDPVREGGEWRSAAEGGDPELGFHRLAELDTGAAGDTLPVDVP